MEKKRECVRAGGDQNQKEVLGGRLKKIRLGMQEGTDGRQETFPDRERSNKWGFLLLAFLLHLVLNQLSFFSPFLGKILLATPSHPSCLRTALPSVFPTKLSQPFFFAWFCLVSC